MKTQKPLLLAALATGAMMAFAPLAAQAGTVTVSGNVRDSSDGVVGTAWCTVEFAAYDGSTNVVTLTEPGNDSAFSVELPGDKKYRVWYEQRDSGGTCGETILDLDGVTEPVTDMRLNLSKAAYCVTYNGGYKRYFVSLDFAEAFAAREGNAESLTSMSEGDGRQTLASRDWTHTPTIALRSATNSDVYAFLKPTSADASNYVVCAAFTTGVKISAGQTTPETPITLSLKDVPGETAQTLTLAYEVELREANDVTAPVLTTPKVALPKSEIKLVVPGKTEDVVVTYDGKGHFIEVNTNGFSKINVSYAFSEDAVDWWSLKKIGTLTNACVQTVYYTLYNKDAYVNVYTNSATVTILPGDVTGSDFEVVTNGAMTVKITGLKSGATLTDGELVIPEAIGGWWVTEIAEMAFKGNQAITKITIPKTVTTIGNWAFANCKKVTEIIVLGEPEHVGTEIFRRAGIENANAKQLVVRADETWFDTNIDALRNITVANDAVTTNNTSSAGSSTVLDPNPVVMSVTILGLSSATPGTWTIDFSIEKLTRWGTINAGNVVFLYRASLTDTPTELTAQSLTDNGDETYSATITMPDGGGTAPSGFFMIKYNH